MTSNLNYFKGGYLVLIVNSVEVFLYRLSVIIIIKKLQG